MSLKIGNIDISKGYLGSAEITKAYLGSVVVLEGGDTDSFITTWRTTTTNESITIASRLELMIFQQVMGKHLQM